MFHGNSDHDETPTVGLRGLEVDGVREIIYPEPGSLRSRKVISRSRARPTGKFPSWKMERMMHWESPNERNAFSLLDGNPAVLGFHEQPLTIRYVLHGESHLHYPDVLVRFEGAKQLWEIKPEREALKPEVADRTRLLYFSLPQFGFEYRMVTAEQLRQEPRLSNVLTMLKFGRKPVDVIEREHIRQLLLDVPFIPWASATNGDLGPRGRAVLFRLALEGVIQFEMDKKLDGSTRFYLTQTRKGDNS